MFECSCEHAHVPWRVYAGAAVACPNKTGRWADEIHLRAAGYLFIFRWTVVLVVDNLVTLEDVLWHIEVAKVSDELVKNINLRLEVIVFQRFGLLRISKHEITDDGHDSAHTICRAHNDTPLWSLTKGECEPGTGKIEVVDVVLPPFGESYINPLLSLAVADVA